MHWAWHAGPCTFASFCFCNKNISSYEYFLLWHISQFFSLWSKANPKENYIQKCWSFYMCLKSPAADQFSRESRVSLRVRSCFRERKTGGRLEKTQTERRKTRAERTRRKKNEMGADSPFKAQTFLLVTAEELIKYKCWRIKIPFKGHTHPLMSKTDLL